LHILDLLLEQHTNMMQVHLFISGLVQGVGYRQFVKRKARKVGLCGWVRNLPDSRVEAVFQGKKEAIDTLIGICKRGPFLAEVQDVQVAWEEGKEEYKEFKVTTFYKYKMI